MTGAADQDRHAPLSSRASEHGVVTVAATTRQNSRMSDFVSKSAEQKGAEADVEGFRKDLGPFVVAAETTRMAMIFTDAKERGNPIVFANDAFLSLTGFGHDEVLAQNFNFLMAQGADPRALAQVEAAFGGSPGDPEIQYRRKDGSKFWASVFISPVRDEHDDVVQHFVSLVDLTRHKQDQAHSTTMIDELNHRVKNTLSTVQSIVFQALRKASDPEVIRESIESRLFALSRSHDLLSRENWEGVGLTELVNEALEPFGVTEGRAERIVITGQDIRLPPNESLALGIGMHELATNAAKYGALSNKAGSIVIAWTLEGDRLILRWQEKDGPPVSPPSRRGFGSRVIERGLAHELKGFVHLDYRADGVICTMDFPKPRAARER